MIGLPWWLSAIVNFVVRLITTETAKRRAEQALRDLGAAAQAQASTREAERQEEIAKVAAARTLPEAIDPADPFLRKD